VLGLARFSFYLAVALIAAQTVTWAQQTDLKGTLRRGPDGKLYLDTSQPPPAPAPAEAAPAGEPQPPAGVAAPASAPAAPAARSGPRSLAVCPHGCPYASLAQALSAAGPGDTVSIGAGTYAEAGVIAADRVKLIAAPGAELKGVAVEGKAAIVVKGNDALIEGLDCSEISVPDHNGACVRLEGHNLTLRHVHFHDSEEGVLTGPDTGTLTIEDSVLERLGAGGLAHGVYAGAMEALVIRRREQHHRLARRARQPPHRRSQWRRSDGARFGAGKGLEQHGLGGDRFRPGRDQISHQCRAARQG
jgi:hypothetical protein